MRLNIIDKFYKSQLEKNSNYIKEITMRKFITFGIFLTHVLAVVLLSFFAYISWNTDNYKHVLMLSLFLHLSVYIYVRKMDESNGYWMFTLIIYLLNYLLYNYELAENYRFIGMLFLIYTIYKTKNLLAYASSYCFLIKPFEESILQNSFEYYNKIQRKLKDWKLFLVILISYIFREIKKKTNCSSNLSLVSEPNINQELILEKICNLNNKSKDVFLLKEKKDFTIFLSNLKEEELDVYHTLLLFIDDRIDNNKYYYPKNFYYSLDFYSNKKITNQYIYNFGLYGNKTISQYSYNKESWSLLKQLEPNLIEYLIENNKSIIEALYFQDFKLSDDEFMAIKNIELKLQNKVKEIEVESRVDSFKYKVVRSCLSSVKKESLLRLFDRNLSDSNLSLINSLQKFFREMYELDPEIFYEDDMKTWLKIFEHLEKIFFYNIYMVESTINGEWKIQYDLSFFKEDLSIILLREDMNKEIPINDTDNTSKKLLKF